MSWTRTTQMSAIGALAVLALASCKRPADEGPAPVDNGVASQGTGDKARSAAPDAPQAPQAPAAPADSNASARPAATSDHGPVSTALSSPPAALAGSLRLTEIARGFKRPVGVEHAPGDATGRLFVVEQHVGRIRILNPGPDGYKVAKQPFYDLRGKVSRGNEQGLLGLTFHPKFADNQRLYVHYTDRRGTTRVIEYRVDAADPNRVDMATARAIFSLDQPYSNHNAGDLEFGPDGELYVGTGDGGAAGDPLRAGQDRKNLLAKMLRFDVDAGDAKPSPVTPEIVQIGLRNPWRYHFDTETGDLYIGDVGQNKYEFIYVVAGDNIDGHNFGWNVVEGNQCYRRKTCDKTGFTPAVIEYGHNEGCSITGGIVYRGEDISELKGVYFYADYCTSIIRSFRWAKDGVRQHWAWRRHLDPRKRISEISAFGVDARGEMFVVSLRGKLYKLERAP